MGFVEALWSVDWERESYPAYEDFVSLPFFVLCFPTVRFFLDRFVFERLANRLIGKGLEANERRKRINKFKESAWKCVYFLSGELLSLSVTYNEPWFKNSRYFWEGPGEQVWPDQKIKFKLKAAYMYAAGFYTYSIFALIVWETRRSDFGVSMSHHVATVVLIVLSYIFRFARVGSLVLAIHDASDVFLEVGKMAKYSSCEWLAVVSFLLFVASWIILRLIYYPFWILWSTRVSCLQTSMVAMRTTLDAIAAALHVEKILEVKLQMKNHEVKKLKNYCMKGLQLKLSYVKSISRRQTLKLNIYRPRTLQVMIMIHLAF